MSSNLANGISVIWRIERSKNLLYFAKIGVNINWPLSEMVFGFTVNCDDNGDYCLKIERIDECEESTTIYGSISADSIQRVEFNSVDFKSGASEELHLKTSDGDKWSNDTFNLLIKLWNSPEKNITANYHAYSKLVKEICNFEWILDTEIKKEGIKEDLPCHVFLKKVPRKFTLYGNDKQNMELEVEMIFESFLKENNIYYVDVKGQDCIYGKIKIDAVGKNRNTLNLLDETFDTLVSSRKDFDPLQIKELIAKKHLFYSQRYLTINVSIECISYSDTEFTEVNFLPDAESIANQLEWSNVLSRHIKEVNSSYETLSQSMHALYKTGKFCDVRLCVGEEKFLCHKSVLCARSPVFRAMFENDMQEKESNVIQIQDMDARSFGLFLNILYTNSLLDVEWEDALEIYEAADKYDVPEVRQMCSEFLISELSITNVCQILEISIAHQDDDIMKEIKKFVAIHLDEVMELPDWNDIISKHALLGEKLMQDISALRFD